MKYIHPLAGAAALLTCLALAAVSCIREDLSECPPVASHEVRIAFSYPEKLPGSREGIDPREMESVTVYVFDQAGRYVTQATDPHPTLSDRDYHLSLTLGAAAYRFIAWGNLNGCYQTNTPAFVPGETSLDDVRLWLDYAPGDTVGFRQHPLFFANATGVVEGTIDQTFILPVVQDTYTIHLTIEGLSGGHNAYRAVISDTNDTYQFDNAFVPSGELHYTALCACPMGERTHTGSLTTMRLHKERNPRLKLYHALTGVLIYEAGLMELLLEIERDGRGIIDFERMYEYDIYLSFAIDPVTGEMTVTIRVNDWTVVEKEVVVDLSKPLPK